MNARRFIRSPLQPIDRLAAKLAEAIKHALFIHASQLGIAASATRMATGLRRVVMPPPARLEAMREFTTG